MVAQPVTSLGAVTPQVIPVCLALPSEHSFRSLLNPAGFNACTRLHRRGGEEIAISAGRTYKRPPIHQERLFAIRLRLRSNSLARAFAPFMVELFTTRFFPARAGHDVPVPLVAKRKLPTPAELNKPYGNFTRRAVEGAIWPEPLVRDFHPLPSSRPFAVLTPRFLAGRSKANGLSPSPLFGRSERAWDRTHGLVLLAWFGDQAKRLYS